METSLSIHNTITLDGNDAPEWIQVLPAGTFNGADGRGPFKVEDAATLIKASFSHMSKLPIDENHSIDLAKRGASTPARGWIVELQSRDDGLWAKVEWTKEGRRLVAEREYLFISPAIMHTVSKPHTITQILRASLVNEPNFSMQSLHKKEEKMEKLLRELLGLEDDADQTAIMTALNLRIEQGDAGINTLKTIAEDVLKLGDDETDGHKIIAALNSKLTETSGGDDQNEISELRDQVKTLNAKLVDVTSTHAKARAEAVIDQAIMNTKLVPALRDHYISRHIKNPTEVEDELKLMPSINAHGLSHKNTLETKEGELSGADAEVCSMMGLDQEAYAKQAKETEKEFG